MKFVNFEKQLILTWLEITYHAEPILQIYQ